MTKSFSRRLRLIVLALFSCILCAGLVLGAACSGNKNNGGITLDRYEVIMYVGDVQDINASGEDKNGKEFSAFDYEWSFSGDDCITIEPAGSGCRITALSNGSATVRVDAGNFSAKCDVVVLDVAVEKVTLDKTELELEVGGDPETITAKADLNNKKTYEGEYEWEVTEGGEFVEISCEGASCTVTAKSAGTAVITATAGGKSANCTVTITGDNEQTHTHTAPDETDEANVVWSWDTSDTTPTANVKITCSVCGETLYEGEAEVSPVDEGYVAPGCESAGTQYYEGTVSFALTNGTQCKYTYEICVTLDPTGHTYPDSETQGDLYHWTFPEGDISEGTEVTIAAECIVCHQTIENLTATITDINTVPATTENNGSITYTAVVEIEGKNVTLTFVEILTAEGHTYPDDGDTTYVVWDWGNMDTQTHTVSYVIYCADGDSFLLTEGTATYSTETKEPTCEVAGSTIYTATMAVTADGTTHTYSGTYSVEIPATGHDWTAVFLWDGVTSITETTNGTVQVELTCSNCNTSETLEATYTRTEYAASTCNDAGHMTFTATLNVEGIDEPFTSSTTVTLPLSGEHTYPEDGSTSVVWDWENRNEIDNTVKLTVYCTVCGAAVVENVDVEYIADQSGTYWVATYTDGTHTYTSSYLIPQDEDTGIVVEIDFNDGSFETGQTFVEQSTSEPKVAPGDAAVVDKDGNDTGFTASGTADDSKTINIATNGGYTALKFDGSIDSTKNSVSYTLPEGTYTVKISYINTSNAGRWATVKAYVDGVFTDLGAVIAEEEKTSGSELKTREITFTLPEETTIYIGSYNSGLYITFIGIYTSEPAETLTPTGVTLSVGESLSLDVGDGVEISAYVIMSDGKTYASYPEVQFNWTISPSGIVSESGSGNSRSLTGLTAGEVTVTVTIEGYECSAYCIIDVLRVDEPTLGDMILSDKVDFSDSTSYTWISDTAPTSSANVSIANEQTLTGGVFTLVTGNSMEIRYNSGSIALYTNGKTQNGVAYIEIDLSEYVGSYVTVTAEMSNTGTNNERYLILSNNSSVNSKEDEKVLVYVASSANSSGHQTLTKSLNVTGDYSKLYLTWDASIYIYNFAVEIWSVIDDSEPTVTGVTLSRSSMVINVGDEIELTATVTMNKGEYAECFEWIVTGDAASIQTTGSTTGSSYSFRAVGEGNVTITVTAGGKSASCTVKILAEGESAYEWVDTSADFSSAAAQAGGTGGDNKSHGGIYEGKFYFADGSYFEDTSSGISGAWDVNTQGKDITFTVSGTENDVSFNIQSASGNGDLITVSIYSSEDTENVLYSLGVTSLVGIDYYSVVGSYLPAGTYVIHTSSSARISELTVSEYVEISDPDHLDVVATNVDFIYGRTISDSDLGLVITLVYKNGRQDALSSSMVTTDLSTAQNNFKVGANTVRVTYNYDGTEYYADIVIYLYEVESITVSDFSMSYTGGTYYTNNVQKIFLVGDSFNHDYAAVTATAFSYDENGNKISAAFILTAAEVIFTLYDPDGKETNYLDGEGVYTVKINVDMSVVLGDSPETEYTISVVDKTGADITTVYVEQNACVELKDGYFTVGSINDAIQLIKLLGASEKERKFIYVGAGQYWEKIYIDIPNLSLIGSNSAETNNLATRQDSTTGGTEIVFDAMNGVMDPSGTTTYSTVGSATVTVASQATGFYAANITFRNYWNTNDLYNEARGITSSTQADAAYINADQSYFYNVTFTGYHDTLEAENGRQVYDHCYIEGRTDYIFGSTATCYFNNCTIHSIGAGTDQSNGGYVVAYKGNGNAGTVEYGYIFDGCRFEGDENVKEHSVALGRAWGEDMMMVIMNSTFDSSFAMGGYTGASSAIRYCQMNYDPDFTKIFEYNNTGDSAIDSTTAGYTVDGTSGLVKDSDGNSVFTIPSEQQVTDFADMSVIFAATNGTVSYGSAWEGKCDVITITVMDNSGVLTTVYGTGAMSVSDLKIAINVRLGDTEVDNIYMDSSFSTELTGSITSNTTVYVSIGEKDMTVTESVSYDFSTEALGDFTESGWLDYLYIDVQDGGSFAYNGNSWYLLNNSTITVKLMAGSSIEFQVYSENSIIVDKNDMVIVEVTEAVSGVSNWYYKYTALETTELSFSANGQLYIRTIDIVASVVYQIGETVDLTGSGYIDGLQGKSVEYNGVIIDTTASGAKFRDNGNSVQINDGTVIIIQSVPGAYAEINWYGAEFTGKADIEVDEYGRITIIFSEAPTSGAYVTGITIIENPGYEGSDEESTDIYAGSIAFDPDSLTVEEGTSDSFTFVVSVTKNSETYTGDDIDITIESDNPSIASESWNTDGNIVTVTGESAGTTYIHIVVKVGDKILVDVQYAIEVTESTSENPGGDDVPQTTTKEYSFSYDELLVASGNVAADTQLDSSWFTGSNDFITCIVGGTSDQIRPGQSGGCIEIKDGTLSVTFKGTGTLTIGFMSTGSENYSNLAVVGQDGVYVRGASSEIDNSVLYESDMDDAGFIYGVKGTTEKQVAFNIEQPGTYTIVFNLSDPVEVLKSDSTSVKASNSAPGRGTRIKTIVMVDTFVDESVSDDTQDSSGHTYPDANDSVHVIWDWEGRTETSDTTGYVTVAIICVDCGETIVSEQTSYIVDPNNDSYWYAEVSENNTTYSGMYRIPGEGSAYVGESFIVSMTADGKTATSESFSSGDTIVSNSLFTVTAMDSFKYHIGGSYGNLQNSDHPVSFTAMSGETHNPDQGLESGTNIGPTYNETTGEWEEAYKDEIIKIEAEQNITLYVYLTLANDSYNSSRTGSIYYSINGGEKVSESVTERETVVRFEIILSAGDVVVIGASNSTTSTDTTTGITSAQNARLWFFGTEAYTTGAEKVNYGVEYTVTFNTNQATIENITTAVFNYSVVSAPVLPNVTGYYFAGWYMNEKCTAAYDFSEPVTCDLQLYAKWVELDAKITYIEGTYESITFEFTDSNASGAKIYYKLVSDASYTLMNDPDAVRQLDAETVRVDIIGLQGDEYYNVKILTSGTDELACRSIYVASYDRSGYAHFGYDEGVGAYEDDGTLKDGALVIYLTEENKNDVTNDMYVYEKAKDSYRQVTLEDETLLSCLTVTGSTDKATYFPDGGDCVIKGIGEILNTRRYSSRMEYGIGKLCQTYGAVVVRVVGEVKATIGELHEEEYTSTKNDVTTTSTVMVGSYDIVGISDYNYTTNGGSVGDNGGMASMTNAHNVTIEGVGEGATINGWGFCFMTANGGYDAAAKTGIGFEVRNLTFKNYTEDAIGMEGVQADSSDVNSELTCPVERLWIHNNTFYVGYCANPVEEDKADGDGSCDFKRGRYLTVSYNYFEGCHKTNLFGANANSLQIDMTIHHNYYCNCSQRMPLVRNGNVHFYNNYIYSDDGNMQSAVYSRDGAFVYAEYNYFEGCCNPMMAEAKVSDAGSDEAGYIKSYGNVLDNCTGDDQSDIVTSRTQTVENTCNYPFGNIDYSSFDTDPALFYYDAAKGRSDCYLTSAAQAKEDVIREAGAFGRSK